MEATAFVDQIKRVGSNQFAVTMSVSMNSFHLKLVDKNDGEATHKEKATYSFVLTVLAHKFHMAPDGALGECMEIRDNFGSCKGLTPYQQRQWCVGELTDRVVNHLIAADLLKPFFLVDIPMTEGGEVFGAEGEVEEVSPIGALRERLRGIGSDIENLICLLNGMRAVTGITKNGCDASIDDILKQVELEENK